MLEASHFLASLVGLGLILLASGLQRRLDAAYHLAVGAARRRRRARAAQGLRLRGVARPGRDARPRWCRAGAEFHRRASLIGERFTVGWGVAVGGRAWSRRGLARLLRPQAHRVLARAVVAVQPVRRRAALPARQRRRRRWWRSALAVWHLLQPVAPARRAARCRQPGGGARRSSPARRWPPATWRCSATSRSCSATTAAPFIMYAVSGRSCVAMGDPVGPPASCARAGLGLPRAVRPPRHLAGVLRGQRRGAADLPRRRSHAAEVRRGGARSAAAPSRSRAARASSSATCCARPSATARSFEVRQPADGAARCCRSCAPISDAWLREKHTREKGFSLGNFDADYLAPVPGRAGALDAATIVAFANLWCAGRARRGVARPDALPARRAGERDGVPVPAASCCGRRTRATGWLNLGMAPLAGPRGARLGAAVEPRRRARLSLRRAVLQLPGPAPVQGQVRSRVAAEVPGLLRRASCCRASSPTSPRWCRAACAASSRSERTSSAQGVTETSASIARSLRLRGACPTPPSRMRCARAS